MDAQIAVLDKNGREVVQCAYKARGKEMPVSKHTGEIKKPPMLIPIDDDSDLPF